jgi:predicted CopG family antitoxin
MFILIFMSKIISVSDEVYGKLTVLKNGRSYTMVIKELLSRKTNKEEILKFAGKGGIDEKEIRSLKKGWKKWSDKYA